MGKLLRSQAQQQDLRKHPVRTLAVKNSQIKITGYIKTRSSCPNIDNLTRTMRQETLTFRGTKIAPPGPSRAYMDEPWKGSNRAKSIVPEECPGHGTSSPL